MATKIILKGSVQGVGCRGYCAKYARKYSLHGAATNMADGSVCVLLNTDDENAVNTYMNSLISNTDNYFFYGRITDYRVLLYNGKIDGDYLF